jgi:hypothetical protein
MGVDTKAILRKGTTIEQIEHAISVIYADVKVRASRSDFMYIVFKDGADQRSLAVSFTNSCESDYGISGVWVSLGFGGNSVEIVKYLCETFGGYIDENDCDDQDFYPVNFNLYSQGSEFTKMDEFRHKVIHEFGFNKVNAAMKLLEEYSQVIGLHK